MTNPKPHEFFHSIPIQIRFNDIDKLEHVNNSVYQQFYDLGKVDYFDLVLGEHMDWNVEGLVIASISIEFLISIQLHDKIEVRSKVYEIGNKSLKMKQEIFNLTTGTVASTSKSVMVNYSNSQMKTLPIPDKWRERISAYEKDLSF
ncbi:MAG: acyl-CoA thioesterase [Bacteroidales bacterium]|nr:MAG: acyl-CoA thioesterase [Bacteroidales bacterium]